MTLISTNSNHLRSSFPLPLRKDSIVVARYGIICGARLKRSTCKQRLWGEKVSNIEYGRRVSFRASIIWVITPQPQISSITCVGILLLFFSNTSLAFSSSLCVATCCPDCNDQAEHLFSDAMLGYKPKSLCKLQAACLWPAGQEMRDESWGRCICRQAAGLQMSSNTFQRGNQFKKVSSADGGWR